MAQPVLTRDFPRRAPHLCAAVILAGSGLLAAPSHAGVAELLLKKGIITPAEYTQLKAEMKAEASAEAMAAAQATRQTTASAPAQPAATTAPAAPTISLNKGLAITSADQRFSAQLGTLIQYDAAVYADSDGIDHNDGTDLRRGRLSLQGTLDRDWQYKFELELAGSSGVEATDVFLRYTGFGAADVTAGHFKIPFSLDQGMSDKDLAFMERALPTALVKSRAPGAMLSRGGSNWSAAAMAYGEQLYPDNTQDEGGGISLRATYAPLLHSDRSLHLGLGAQQNWLTQTAGDDTPETLRYSSKPESTITSLRMIDTGNIPGDVANSRILGAEIAGTLGPVMLSAEYMRASILRDADTDLDVDGWYAQASWALTGETRVYDGAKGIYKGLAAGSDGAWELAARYSELDLNDTGLSGGRERNSTLGLNWYANDYVRLSGNWVHVFDIDGGAYDGENLDALQMRVQLAY